MTGNVDGATIKQYYDENSVFMLSNHTIDGTELTQSYCNSLHDGYSCTVNNKSITTDYTYDNTSDYTVTIEWEASVISNGPFRQSAYNGDHKHLCTAANRTATNRAIKPFHKGRNNQITVRGEKSTLFMFYHFITIFYQLPVHLHLFLFWSLRLPLVLLLTGHILIYLVLMGI